MRSQHQTIVVRRGVRRSDDGGHGGAWKVAFADFTLAMMAFFLVMWVLAAATDEEKAEIVGHLSGGSQTQNPFAALFEDNSPFVMDMGGSALPAAVPGMPYNPANMGNSLTTSVVGGDGDSYGGLGEEGPSLVAGRYETQEQMVLLGEYLKGQSDFLSASDVMTVDVVPQGLRILVNDDKDKPMFKRGQAYMTPYFEDLLLALAPTFSVIENPLMITGHADAAAFTTATSGNNWELSGRRAQKARRVLEYGGMPAERVVQVSAMSDTMLLDSENPTSDINRRIEILVLNNNSEQALYQLFGREAPNPLDEAKRVAEQNRPIG